MTSESVQRRSSCVMRKACPRDRSSRTRRWSLPFVTPRLPLILWRPWRKAVVQLSAGLEGRTPSLPCSSFVSIALSLTASRLIVRTWTGAVLPWTAPDPSGDIKAMDEGESSLPTGMQPILVALVRWHATSFVDFARSVPCLAIEVGSCLLSILSCCTSYMACPCNSYISEKEIDITRAVVTARAKPPALGGMDH